MPTLGQARSRLRRVTRNRANAVRKWNTRVRAAQRAVRRATSDRLWGGSRYYTNRAIRLVGERALVTSRKRWATFGNPGSDHHRSQTAADAVDFGTANNHVLKNEVARHNGSGGDVADFGTWLTERNGRTYRHQAIAGTHGTGPHFHYGVKRIA